MTLEEREACAELAEAFGSPEVALAIRQQTCALGGHDLDGSGVCLVCHEPAPGSVLIVYMPAGMQ